MKSSTIEKIYYKSFNNIDFVNKYQTVMNRYNHSINDILSKMDKTIIKKLFKEAGYEFKISSPGQFFEFFESFNVIKLKVSIKVSGGMIVVYVYIYINNEVVKIDYTNFAFIYRILKNNMEEITNAPNFINYDELLFLLKDVMIIYEDFKKEFLIQMKSNNLMEK